MASYRKMYYHLFNAVTDSLQQLEQGRIPLAVYTLMQAQADCEKMFMESAPDIQIPEHGNTPKP